MDQTQIARVVDDVIRSRHSVRAFLPTPVSREQVVEILEVASRAPSGTNIQPWKCHVLTGEPQAELSRRILEAFDDPQVMETHTEDWPYYPEKWVSPYIDRRRKIGWDMYGLLGIGKGDKDKMHEQHGRNFRFFDAPVGIVFTIDRMMRTGSYFDYGMFLQNIMLATRARGLDTCPQQAFSRFHRIIEEFLALPETESVVCGMALGYADPDAPVNRLQTEREPVTGFARFHGF